MRHAGLLCFRDCPRLMSHTETAGFWTGLAAGIATMETPDRDSKSKPRESKGGDEAPPRSPAGSRPSTHPFEPDADRSPGEEKAEAVERPVTSPLGVAVLFAESFRRKSSISSELGLTYQLREGDLLFIGKFPPPLELVQGDGRRRKVTASHLFPFLPTAQSSLGKGYAFISGQHMTIEMLPDGSTLVRDFSTNGVYLRGRQQHLCAREESTESVELAFEGGQVTTKPAATQPLSGPETIVLGIDLGKASAEAKKLAEQQQVHVIPFTHATPPEQV